MFDVLDEVRTALDRLAALDPIALGDSGTVIAMQREVSRFAAVQARTLAAYDDSRDWCVDGAHNSPAWVCARTRIPKDTARQRMRLGHAVRNMPFVETAWLAGDIDTAHVQVLAAARTPGSCDVFAKDEAGLVEQAATKRFDHFKRIVALWEQIADPDGTEDKAEKQRQRRGASLSQSFRDEWFGEQRFDPISGEIVSNELTRLEKMLFEQDWKDASARLGRDPKVGELGRTARQRRADAYVEMAIRSRSTPPGSRRPEPLFSVVIDLETVAGRICELANRTIVTPGSLVPHLDRALIERIVFSGPSRRITDVGSRHRFFTGALRRGIQVRDRECYHPMCDRPAERCDIDHIQPAARGGETEQHNGRPACGFHNRLRNRQPDPPGRPNDPPVPQLRR